MVFGALAFLHMKGSKFEDECNGEGDGKKSRHRFERGTGYVGLFVGLLEVVYRAEKGYSGCKQV